MTNLISKIMKALLKVKEHLIYNNITRPIIGRKQPILKETALKSSVETIKNNFLFNKKTDIFPTNCIGILPRKVPEDRPLQIHSNFL